jgi:hypothetical protein
MRIFICAAMIASIAPCCFSQAKSGGNKTSGTAGGADLAGMTCAQVLQMPSTDWVAKFNEKDASPEGTLRAIGAYGKCYDARTSRLAASLGKAGKGPLMGARGNFGDFEKALNDFAAMAMAATTPPADEQRKAFAALYEKQFRYDFYESYEHSSAKPARAAGKSGAPAPTANAEAAQQSGDATEVSEMTKAKNRFGELLGLLPEEKMHELHRAFGRIFSGATVSDATKLAVYRYAIFLLEPPAEKPFSPPPF